MNVFGHYFTMSNISAGSEKFDIKSHELTVTSRRYTTAFATSTEDFDQIFTIIELKPRYKAAIAPRKTSGVENKTPNMAQKLE